MADYREPKVTRPSRSRTTMIGFVVVLLFVIFLAWGLWPG